MFHLDANARICGASKVQTPAGRDSVAKSAATPAAGRRAAALACIRHKRHPAVMVKISRVTTKSGDAGETGLGDGSRIAKTHPRIEAVGAVDEANSAIGVARAGLAEEFSEIDAQLGRIQNDLFDLGADLATPAAGHEPGNAPLRVTEAQVDRIEAATEALNAGLPPLKSFILPAGKSGAAELHLARALARRAERAVLALAESGAEVGTPVRLYVNRLSDFLFVAARYVCVKSDGETLWRPGGGGA